MSLEAQLQERSESKCELCASANALGVYEVPASEAAEGADACAYLCDPCRQQLDEPEALDVHHWRCLNESMWSETPAVQVLAWRMLKRLSGTEGWARELLDMLYLEPETQSWAEAGVAEEAEEAAVRHVDSNGSELAAGDTVVLVKDLNVKGGGFTAKRGTAVRNIALVSDNPKHIEGRVEGQRIVILTQFVKKQG
ncbi:MAG TPA: PhnA protein [Planctomycetes bacterium]|nr:PhnA protein [Planctomycetota bacterium]|tara:strand:+ start:38 stop:625 length:588 start_codon:yes stop_codon:yes gene_type:complete